MIYVFDRVENIVRKGENASKLPAFSPFPTMLFKTLFLRVVKSRDYMVKSWSLPDVYFRLGPKRMF